MENIRLKFGQVVWLRMVCDDGSGIKSRPAIVLEHDGSRVRIIYGTSQHATNGALLPGEFLVENSQEIKKMGCTKVARYSWIRGGCRYVNINDVVEVIGECPDTVLGRAFRAAKIVGVK